MDISIQPTSFSDITSSNQLATGTNSSPGRRAPGDGAAATQAAQPIHDTVKLSTTSQIQSMKQSGATVTQIAANLGVSATEVDQALGITASSSSSSEASILAALSNHR